MATRYVYPGQPWIPSGRADVLDEPHSWRFEIDGIDVTFYVDPGSVDMTDAEGSEVDTLYLELVDRSGSLSFSDWQEIIWIIDHGTASEIIWFGGFLINPERTSISEGQGYMWRIKCESYITLLARLPAGLRSWVNKFPGEIVIDLLDQAGLTSQNHEQGEIGYKGNDTTTAEFRDTDQVWDDWSTSSGNAGYALVATNTDGSVSWGYLGEFSSSDITVYKDWALTTRGWNGVAPVAGGKTPASYHVRRAELFSGHRPIDTTGVQTGDNALLSFGTTGDETVAQVIDRLAKQLGWVWRVDGQAVLYFGDSELDVTPFNVSDGDNADYNQYYPARAGTFMLAGMSGMDVRNRVVIHGGAMASDQINELLYANNIDRIYQLAHRNLIDITVLVNGAVVADGTVWWNTFDDRIVLVNYAEGWIWFVEDFLIQGDTIQVLYRYWIGLEYTQRDETSINQRRQVLTYEISDPSITSEEQAQELATQVLADYSGGRCTGSFEVWRLGLRAGQNVKLKFPGYGIDEGFVIRKMNCRIDASNTGLVVACEFGSRQMPLSQAVAGGGAATTDLLQLGQLGPVTHAVQAALANPISSDGALAKHNTVIVDASSGSLQLTLPPAILRTGASILVIRIDQTGNTVTLAATGGATINGASDMLIQPTGYEAILCYSDGTNWYGLRMQP